jgi:hypothetical protein
MTEGGVGCRGAERRGTREGQTQPKPHGRESPLTSVGAGRDHHAVAVGHLEDLVAGDAAVKGLKLRPAVEDDTARLVALDLRAVVAVGWSVDY